jgi:hypothetical protein
MRDCRTKLRTNKFTGKTVGLVVTNSCLFSAFVLLVVPE